MASVLDQGGREMAWRKLILFALAFAASCCREAWSQPPTHRENPPEEVAEDWRLQDGLRKGGPYDQAAKRIVRATRRPPRRELPAALAALEQGRRVTAGPALGGVVSAGVCPAPCRPPAHTARKGAANRLHQALRPGRLALRLHRGPVRRPGRAPLRAGIEPVPARHARPVRRDANAAGRSRGSDPRSRRFLRWPPRALRLEEVA